jgi:hypothetical protein
MLTGTVVQLSGLFVGCVFYGIFLVTFGCLWNQSPAKMARCRIAWPMHLITLFLFINSSFHVILGFVRCLDPHFFYQDKGLPSKQTWVEIIKVGPHLVLLRIISSQYFF